MRFRTWVNRFSADPTLINNTFVLNGTQRTLIGIMPPRFAWSGSDLWIPTKPSVAISTGMYRFPEFLFLLGHLKPGVSLRQAQSDFTGAAEHLSPLYPTDSPKKFSLEIETLPN